MGEYVDSLSWEAGTALAFVFGIFLSTLIILLARRFMNHKLLKAHHDVSGFVFANLGVLYSVLLGFTVVNVQSRFDKIKEYAQIEAGYLLELYHDAEVFSEKDQIRKAISDYANDLIHREWELMATATYIPKLNHKLESLWKVYYTIELHDKKQELWFSESISKLNQLINARFSRLLGIQDSLSPETWTVLLITGAVVIAFVCVFGFDSLALQILLGSSISSIIVLMLFLIRSMDSVYSGAIQVTPDAIINVLESFKYGS